MRCDRILQALATGAPFRRRLAARHLARCPACSMAAEELRRISEALADAPILTESQRRSWMEAADEVTPGRPSSRGMVVRRLAIAASILGLIALGGWPATRPTRLGTSPVVAVVDPSAVKRTTLRDLDALRADTASLARELDDLLREVDLLDARRDVDALQLKFASNGGRDGP